MKTIHGSVERFRWAGMGPNWGGGMQSSVASSRVGAVRSVAVLGSI
jgi:hypothetical protein